MDLFTGRARATLCYRMNIYRYQNPYQLADTETQFSSQPSSMNQDNAIASSSLAVPGLDG